MGKAARGEGILATVAVGAAGVGSLMTETRLPWPPPVSPKVVLIFGGGLRPQRIFASLPSTHLLSPDALCSPVISKFAERA